MNLITVIFARTSGPHGEEVKVAREAQYFPGGKRPVWFVFSGMGSQWAGMGTQLMAIPIFAGAIEKYVWIFI